MAGDTATLDVTLSGGPVPAGLQWTLNYSASDFTSVQLNIGPAAAAAGKLLACNGGAGYQTCVIIGGAEGIPDGVVATASVTTATGGSGTTNSILEMANVSAVSPAGDPIPIDGANGTVTILQPAPPPAPVTLTGLTCPATVPGGSPVQCTVTLSAVAPASGAVIALASSGTSLAAPATVTVPAGSSTAPFAASSAPLLTDQSATLIATLASTSRSATVSVIGVKPSQVMCAPATLSGVSTAACTVSLNRYNAPSSFDVTLSDNLKSLSVPVTARFTPGQSSVTFTVKSSKTGKQRSGSLWATFNGATASTTIVVVP